jgi:hypothetical protein
MAQGSAQFEFGAVESFLAAGGVAVKRVFGTLGAGKTLPQKPKQPQPQDVILTAANQAHKHLIGATGQAELAKKLVPPPITLPPPVPGGGATKKRDKEKEEANEEDVSKKQKLVPNPTPPAIAEHRVHTLEQHQRRDQELELFATTINRTHHRAPTDVIITTPKAVEVLRYCAQFKDTEMPWYRNMTLMVSENPNLRFQQVHLLKHEVIVTFFREPDGSPFERPCCNLDRNPLPHENAMRCAMHILSENMAGGPYRLREILWNEQSTKINAALDYNARLKPGQKAVDPCQYLSPVPEMCILCHIRLPTEVCLDRIHKKKEREAKEKLAGGKPIEKTPPCVPNKLMVEIDGPGKYDRRKMLVTDDPGMDVVGPIPLWNARNYIPCKIAGTNLRGVEESPNLLFRPPREPSLEQMESLQSSNSIQSTPTGGAPPHSMRLP